MLSLNLVYELNNWPSNPSSNFTLKKCLFGTGKLRRNTIKGKFIYGVWGIAFDIVVLWSFVSEFAGNVVIFSVDTSSSSRTDNQKNNFAV